MAIEAIASPAAGPEAFDDQSADELSRLGAILIDRGSLPAFRIGWLWRVLLHDLEVYVARQQAVERLRIGK